MTNIAESSASVFLTDEFCCIWGIRTWMPTIPAYSIYNQRCYPFILTLWTMWEKSNNFFYFSLELGVFCLLWNTLSWSFLTPNIAHLPETEAVEFEYTWSQSASVFIQVFYVWKVLLHLGESKISCKHKQGCRSKLCDSVRSHATWSWVRKRVRWTLAYVSDCIMRLTSCKRGKTHAQMLKREWSNRGEVELVE